LLGRKNKSKRFFAVLFTAIILSLSEISLLIKSSFFSHKVITNSKRDVKDLLN